jgi:hypothetical protein
MDSIVMEPLWNQEDFDDDETANEIMFRRKLAKVKEEVRKHTRYVQKCADKMKVDVNEDIAPRATEKKLAEPISPKIVQQLLVVETILVTNTATDILMAVEMNTNTEDIPDLECLLQLVQELVRKHCAVLRRANNDQQCWEVVTEAIQRKYGALKKWMDAHATMTNAVIGGCAVAGTLCSAAVMHATHMGLRVCLSGTILPVLLPALAAVLVGATFWWLHRYLEQQRKKKNAFRTEFMARVRALKCQLESPEGLAALLTELRACLTQSTAKWESVCSSLAPKAQCSICFDDMTKGQPGICRPSNCRHIFHEECLQNWRATSFTCPYCRTESLDYQILE